MKNIKILSVLVVAVALLLTMISCGGGSDEATVDCTISVVAGEEYIFDEYPYQAAGVDGAAPTILNAVEGLFLFNDIAYVVSGSMFDSITGVDGTVYENGADNYFWLCTVNGEELKGRANSVEVQPGDVIVYTYTYVDPEA